MDNLFDKYTDLIEKEPNRAHIYLTSLYGELFNVVPNQFLYSLFGRLIKTYGIQRTFFGLLDIADKDIKDLGNPSAFITFFIKKRLEPEVKFPSQDLSEYIKKQEKEVGKKRKIIKRTLDE